MLALPWGDASVLEGRLAGAFGLACHLGRGGREAVAGFPRREVESGAEGDLLSNFEGRGDGGGAAGAKG